ncbi:MAG: hypothetical protein GY799_25200 [Desulfobulbaceae bacterium]|nr:hypothetical protein [Desulfobulbaceae bacterium]
MAKIIDYKPIDPIIRRRYPLSGGKITLAKILEVTGVTLSLGTLSKRARVLKVQADKSAAAGRTWATKVKKYGEAYKSVQSARKLIREKYPTHGASWCAKKTGRTRENVMRLAHDEGVKLLPETRQRLVSEAQEARFEAKRLELSPEFVLGEGLFELERLALFMPCTSIHRGVTRETYIRERC